MPLLTDVSLDYTDKDFESLRLRLQGLAKSVYPEWTDFNQANFGNLLLEMFAYVGDKITFYQDSQARELFWPTVTSRINALRLAKLINFQFATAQPATGNVTITVPAGQVSRVVIPPGTRFFSSDPVEPLPYRTTNTENLYIETDATSITVTAEQAEVIVNEPFESNGGPNQEVILNRVPYLEGSLSISATDGDYVEIDSLVNVESDDKKRFSTYVDQVDRCHVLFGNGTLGSIPQGSCTATYKITRGSLGNTEANRITTMGSTLVNESSDPVAGVSVTNAEPFTGGADRMSIAEARSLAPASLKALTRTITKGDFESHAREVSGIARALMLTSAEDSSTVPDNVGYLFIVGRGEQLASGRYLPAAPTDAQISAVLNKVLVEKPCTITFRPVVQGPNFRYIDVLARVHFATGYVPTSVALTIFDNLKDYFAVSLVDGSANSNIDFGANITDSTGNIVAEIAWSDILNVIRDSLGVRKISERLDGTLLHTSDDGVDDPSLGGRSSLSYGATEFPKLRRVVIINAEAIAGSDTVLDEVA